MALALVSTYAAWLMLSLSMGRHHRQLCGREAIGGSQAWYRVGGVAGLLAGYAGCAWQWGWSVGAVAWCGVLSATSLLFVLLLAWRPRWAVWALVGLAGLALPAAML